VVGAILGLGGGILLVPILTIFYGVDLHYAMGASIISVIATSSGAAASYLRTGLSNLRVGLFLVVATITGALTGAFLAGVVPTRWLELILGLALTYSAYTTIRQLADELPEDVSTDGLAIRFDLEGTYHDVRLQRDISYRARNVAGGFVAMYGAGVLSGMLGIGSGAFKVLAMDYLMRLPMKVSTATSNFMIGLTAAASAGIYFSRAGRRLPRHAGHGPHAEHHGAEALPAHRGVPRALDDPPRARHPPALMPERPVFPVEHLVARVLLVGGLLGLTLISLGLGLYAAHGGFQGHVLALSPPVAGATPPGVFRSLRQIAVGLRQRPLDPLAVGALGLVVLMATPGVAVTLAIPGFLLAGDGRFALIATLVLTMLLVSLLLAGAVHG
jgi:uncharacterized membrane protein YfcA/uncharacterized membrane protein